MPRRASQPRASPCERARPQKGVRKSIPAHTFADWNDPDPGFTEIDLVAHCGGDVSGSFVHTLVVTDIASGWTECVPLLVRDSSLVVEALARLRTSMPFRLRGIDSDNGSEFVNETLFAYCKAQGIEFTRARAYRKNDQAWVEQKNGAVVRRLVGHRRLEGIAAAEALSRLYAGSRLFVNFFQPSFKLADKTRVGSRVKKRYHPPETPCARLLASEVMPSAAKQRLSEVAGEVDPLRLLDEIRTEQHRLVALAAGQLVHLSASANELNTFLQSLATAWSDGEVRPTHQANPKPPRNWRTRKDPFEVVWPLIREWLEVAPETTATQLLARVAHTVAITSRGLKLAEPSGGRNGR